MCHDISRDCSIFHEISRYITRCSDICRDQCIYANECHSQSMYIHVYVYMYYYIMLVMCIYMMCLHTMMHVVHMEYVHIYKCRHTQYIHMSLLLLTQFIHYTNVGGRPICMYQYPYSIYQYPHICNIHIWQCPSYLKNA